MLFRRDLSLVLLKLLLLLEATTASEVRLVDGPTHNEGRVEIFLNGSWGTVCDDYWGLEEARVVCHQLGFPGAVAAPKSASYGAGNRTIHLSNLRCEGDERNLESCSHIRQHDCGNDEDAGVVCSPAVRLIGGSSSNDGRVEVFSDGLWGTVCDDHWDLRDGAVVCRELGFADVSQSFGQAAFGEGVGIGILLSDVQCSGDEKTLFDCPHNEVGRHNCTHSNDTGLRCVPKLRLVDGNASNEGRLEIFINSEWGTVCDENWGIRDAQVACREMGFPDAIEATLGGSYGSGTGPIHLTKVKCSGSEYNLESCLHDPGGNCNHDSDAGVVCTRAVRLTDGTLTTEGRVEVFWHSVWGTVCNHGWDRSDATVVCRQLGLPHDPQGVSVASFGAGSGQTLLSDAACSGDEETLFECRNNGLANHNCDHTEDAGVRCVPPLRLVGSSVRNKGRLEILLDGEWGSVCKDSWGQEEANVACRQLGFHTATSHDVPVDGGTGPIHLDHVGCSGLETDLWRCQHSAMGIHNCNHDGDVGIECAPAVRLVNSVSVSEGRLEVYSRGVWGTVCDVGFDITDAAVVCRELGFLGAHRVLSSSVYGPNDALDIALVGVMCSGDEATVLKCPQTGTHSCGHDQDVGVQCVAGCSRPSSLSDVFIISSYEHDIYPPGYTIEFGCTSGYQLSGSPSRICRLDSTWSGEPAECTAEPPEVTGCMLTPNTSDVLILSPFRAVYSPGESVTFHCPDGYRLNGSAMSFCKNDLTWSNQPAGCKLRGCKPITDPSADSAMVVWGQQADYRPGDSLHFACPEGYVLKGSAERVCRSDYTWSGQTPECDEERTTRTAAIAGGMGGFTLLIIVFSVAVILVKKRREGHLQIPLPEQHGTEPAGLTAWGWRPTQNDSIPLATIIREEFDGNNNDSFRRGSERNVSVPNYEDAIGDAASANNQQIYNTYLDISADDLSDSGGVEPPSTIDYIPMGEVSSQDRDDNIYIGPGPRTSVYINSDEYEGQRGVASPLPAEDPSAIYMVPSIDINSVNPKEKH